MRTLKLLAVAALAASTTACVETVDQGYGNYGYSDASYGPSQGYYAPSQSYYASQPAYYAPATTYYAPPQVVTRTQYVPVPVAVPQHTFTPQAPVRAANSGHQHDRPQANNTPPATHQPPSGNNQPGNNQHHGNGGNNGRDRDGDGRPDRRS